MIDPKNITNPSPTAPVSTTIKNGAGDLGVTYPCGFADYIDYKIYAFNTLYGDSGNENAAYYIGWGNKVETYKVYDNDSVVLKTGKSYDSEYLSSYYSSTSDSIKLLAVETADENSSYFPLYVLISEGDDDDDVDPTDVSYGIKKTDGTYFSYISAKSTKDVKTYINHGSDVPPKYEENSFSCIAAPKNGRASYKLVIGPANSTYVHDTLGIRYARAYGGTDVSKQPWTNSWVANTYTDLKSSDYNFIRLAVYRKNSNTIEFDVFGDYASSVFYNETSYQ